MSTHRRDAGRARAGRIALALCMAAAAPVAGEVLSTTGRARFTTNPGWRSTLPTKLCSRLKPSTPQLMRRTTSSASLSTESKHAGPALSPPQPLAIVPRDAEAGADTGADTGAGTDGNDAVDAGRSPRILAIRAIALARGRDQEEVP